MSVRVEQPSGDVAQRTNARKDGGRRWPVQRSRTGTRASSGPTTPARSTSRATLPGDRSASLVPLRPAGLPATRVMVGAARHADADAGPEAHRGNVTHTRDSARRPRSTVSRLQGQGYPGSTCDKRRRLRSCRPEGTAPHVGIPRRRPSAPSSPGGTLHAQADHVDPGARRRTRRLLTPGASTGTETLSPIDSALPSDAAPSEMPSDSAEPSAS